LIYIKSNKFGTPQELSNYLGVHIRTTERWLADYKEAGIVSILTDKPKNKSSKIINKEIHKGLK
jgi:transposase